MRFSRKRKSTLINVSILVLTVAFLWLIFGEKFIDLFSLSPEVKEQVITVINKVAFVLIALLILAVSLLIAPAVISVIVAVAAVASIGYMVTKWFGSRETEEENVDINI
jgi:hypothetical protein